MKKPISLFDLLAEATDPKEIKKSMPNTKALTQQDNALRNEMMKEDHYFEISPSKKVFVRPDIKPENEPDWAKELREKKWK